MMISISPYWIVGILAFAWLGMKIYGVYMEIKYRKKIRENGLKYALMLAKSLNETKILDKARLSKKDSELLLSTLEKLPPADPVKRMIKIISYYKEHILKHSRVYDHPDALREKFTIPLMRNFIYLFGLTDESLSDFINKEEDKYREKGIKLKVYVPLILEKIMKRVFEKSKELEAA